MKRSEINRQQREALALFAEHRFALPPFATWGEAEWRENLETASYCRAHQMGWDITDFGSPDFRQPGPRDLLRPQRPAVAPRAGPMPRSCSSSARTRRRRTTPTASRWRTSSSGAAAI